MKLEGENVLLRIFIDTFQKWHHRPVYEAIVMKARELHLAGATVFRGIMGYGKHSRVHTVKWEVLSTDLPIVIEIVDSEEKIRAFMPHVDEIVQEGLVTVEKVKVLKYAARSEEGKG